MWKIFVLYFPLKWSWWDEESSIVPLLSCQKFHKYREEKPVLYRDANLMPILNKNMTLSYKSQKLPLEELSRGFIYPTCFLCNKTIKTFEMKQKVDCPFLTTRYLDLSIALIYCTVNEWMNERMKNVLYPSSYNWKRKVFFSQNVIGKHEYNLSDICCKPDKLKQSISSEFKQMLHFL